MCTTKRKISEARSKLGRKLDSKSHEITAQLGFTDPLKTLVVQTGTSVCRMELRSAVFCTYETEASYTERRRTKLPFRMSNSFSRTAKSSLQLSEAIHAASSATPLSNSHPCNLAQDVGSSTMSSCRMYRVRFCKTCGKRLISHVAQLLPSSRLLAFNRHTVQHLFVYRLTPLPRSPLLEIQQLYASCKQACHRNCRQPDCKTSQLSLNSPQHAS